MDTVVNNGGDDDDFKDNFYIHIVLSPVVVTVTTTAATVVVAKWTIIFGYDEGDDGSHHHRKQLTIENASKTEYKDCTVTVTTPQVRKTNFKILSIETNGISEIVKFGTNIPFQNIRKLIEACKNSVLEISEINVEDVVPPRYLFADCVKLRKIDRILGQLKGTAEGMFSGCVSLVSLPLSPIDTSGVNSMRSMFFRCKKLVSIPWCVNTSATNDTSRMFDGCSSFTAVAAVFAAHHHPHSPVFLPELLTNVQFAICMFSGCRSLVEIPRGLRFNCARLHSAWGMFAECVSLTRVTHSIFSSSSASSVLTDVHELFDGCSSLHEIAIPLHSLIPNSVTTREGRENIFRGCLRLPLETQAALANISASLLPSAVSMSLFEFSRDFENVVNEKGNVITVRLIVQRGGVGGNSSGSGGGRSSTEPPPPLMLSLARYSSTTIAAVPSSAEVPPPPPPVPRSSGGAGCGGASSVVRVFDSEKRLFADRFCCHSFDSLCAANHNNELNIVYQRDCGEVSVSIFGGGTGDDTYLFEEDDSNEHLGAMHTRVQKLEKELRELRDKIERVTHLYPSPPSPPDVV